MAWTPTARGAVAALGLVLGAAVAIHVENQDNLLRSVVIIASGGIGGLLLTAPGRRARWREDTGGLKLIALAAMVVDHGGWVFDPATGLWRDVGRLAFPLFAFQVAVGFAHTSSRVRYLTRLLVIAIIAQAPFPYCIGPGLNPLFTLSLALAALWLIESAQSRGAKLLLVALALWLGGELHARLSRLWRRTRPARLWAPGRCGAPRGELDRSDPAAAAVGGQRPAGEREPRRAAAVGPHPAPIPAAPVGVLRLLPGALRGACGLDPSRPGVRGAVALLSAPDPLR